MDSGRDTAEQALYENDFFSWTERQASYLRDGRRDLADIANIAEEIESQGKSRLSALRASYRLIAMHLLKLACQPGKATAIWENTINRERSNVADLLEDSPGLKPKRAALFAKAYATARSDAAFETRIDIERFPEEAPFSVDQAEDKAFWPAEVPRGPRSAKERTKR